jgi:crossover junction endodeoxyribonuclease RuvC
MIRILGIDPGTRITGFGVIDTDGRRNIYVTSGCIRMKQAAMPDRLRVIFEGINTLIASHKPEQVAIEKIFMHRNADSALKLGMARGAAICGVVTQSVPVFEYTPAEIKQSIVGKGNAGKQQIQHMVKVLLNLSGEPQADAADALATALCHANHRAGIDQIVAATV